MMWKVKQQTEAALDLYIYGDVEGDGYDFWSGQKLKSETSANYFREVLKTDVPQINIYINSFGGSVFEGTAIYNQLKRHPAHKTVYVDGFACSIASVIAMAGDEVIMPKNTLMMIHNAWTVSMGNAAELRKAADDLDVINSAGRNAYLEKAGDRMTEEELVAMMDAETWLNAEDCLRLGLADSLADEVDLDGAARQLAQNNPAIVQRIPYDKILAAKTVAVPAVDITALQKPAEEPKEETRKSLFALLKGE